MKKLISLLGSLLLVFGFLGVAGATTFTLDNFNVALNNDDPGLVVHSSPIQAPFSFDLNVGESITFDLFAIWTDEGSVNSGEDEVHSPISVSMNFTTPPPSFGSSVSGFTFGGRAGLFNRKQWGEVTWNGPETFYFGNGTGELVISLSNETFNYGGLGGTRPGECFGADVEATITYAKAAVPEPSLLLLLGAGLIGVAAVRRKIKK